MKVALVQPPLSGHATRGTGSYTDQLIKALKQMKDRVDVQLIQFTDSQDRFDLIHYPYFDPFFLTLPLFKKKPTIVTVHDLIPLKFSDHFPKGIKGTIKWYIQKLSLLSTSAIVTDSYASQKDILQFTWIPKEKIHVVHLAAGEEFQKVKDMRILQSVRRKYHLTDDFILHVGDVNYNKNIIGLIRAFHIVHKQNPKLQLVLVGKGFQQTSPQLVELLKLAKNLKIQQYIRRLGHVSLHDLIALYNLARVYVQPSFAEGFGLPVLEAFVCGCPVVASKTTSLPEIVGEAGSLIDPGSSRIIANAIMVISLNERKRNGLIQKGFIQVKQFSWEKCAKETATVYKEVYENALKQKGWQ